MTTNPLTVEISITVTVYCQVDSSQVGGGGGHFGILYIEACLSDLLQKIK